MVHLQERKSKGTSYLYLDRSLRVGKRVFKISKYLGRKSRLSEAKIAAEKKKFLLEMDERVLSFLMREISRKYALKYPLLMEEARKIEEMNLKYREIRKALSKGDWSDIKKRFVANFVFESNALEGNSLTLKNFSEIVFENRIAGSADLREVHDAKNSYAAFSRMLSGKRDITEAYIIGLHKMIMENIDERIGYKRLPNVILGRRLELVPPEKVPEEMKKLLAWYGQNRDSLHPLELAFRFHHRFETIHPFADGNGRVGRMLLNYILITGGYYPVIIRKSHRNSYLRALQAADQGQYIPLIRFAIEKAKETYRKFFETYYRYTS